MLKLKLYFYITFSLLATAKGNTSDIIGWCHMQNILIGWRRSSCTMLPANVSSVNGSINKKLSYCRGMARHSMLGSSCYVSQVMAVIKVSVSKSDLQGH